MWVDALPWDLLPGPAEREKLAAARAEIRAPPGGSPDPLQVLDLGPFHLQVGALYY